MLQEKEHELDIEDLRIFVETADAGGVSSAALRLGMSKSMVSRRIAQLESELGVQLLARTTRGIALTEAGATFREYAARTFAELDVVRETILPAGELRGRIRVAAPLTFGPTHFAPVLSQMARLHPRLQIDSSYTDRFVDLVEEGFDCAIRVGYLPDSTLVARRIGPILGALVASPAYIEAHGAPATPDEIVNHEAVFRNNEAWQFTSNRILEPSRESVRPIDGGHHEASQRAPAPRLTHQTTIHARTNSAMTVRRITIPATLSECIRAASIFRAQPCRRRFVSNGLRTRAKAYLPTGLVPRRP